MSIKNKCYICGKEVSYPKNAAMYEQLNQGMLFHICDECKNVANRISAKEKNISAKKCTYCNGNFVYPNDGLVYLGLHGQINVCSRCQNEAERIRTNKVYKCKRCGKSFIMSDDQRMIKDRMFTDSGLPAPTSYFCDECLIQNSKEWHARHKKELEVNEKKAKSQPLLEPSAITSEKHVEKNDNQNRIDLSKTSGSKVSKRYLDLENSDFMAGIFEHFKAFSESYYSYSKKIDELIKNQNDFILKKEKEVEESIHDIANTISQLQYQKEQVKELCKKNGLSLNSNIYNGNIQNAKHTPYTDLEELLGSSKIGLLFYYDIPPRKKHKCQELCQEEVNFLCSAIEKNKNRINKLNFEKQNEILRIKNETRLRCETEEKNKKNLLSTLSAYIRSESIQELNNHWNEYLEKYQIDRLLEYDLNKQISHDVACLGFVHKRIPMHQDLLAYISNEFKKQNFFHLSDNEMIIQIPIFDVLTDMSNKYYIKLPSADIVQQGLQAYLLRLLSNSQLNEYDFVFMDPISNGKSFLDVIALVHDDGYGITNNIACDKNEIAKDLSELSNKIKRINQTIKGYSSIYDYNNDNANSKINTTIFIAYNFCDEYYREDLLSPIFENADKCGITIFTIAPFNRKHPTEKVEFVTNSYAHETFTNDNEIIRVNSSDEFVFTAQQCNTVEWINDYDSALKKGTQVHNFYEDVSDRLPNFYSLDSTNGMHIPFALDKKNNIVSFNIAVPLCYHAFISGQTGSGKSVMLHSIISGIIRNYHPDDVELWLVDYKAVEFAEYVTNTPPHIKLVGLDTSWEFTKSYLDKLKAVMEERKKIIMEAGFQKIEEYKAKYGKNSMSRIVLIIDEAHRLSQQLSEDRDYMQDFENFLSEYRALGLTIILSDQAFGMSMKGITAKGKDQITVRLAMKNSISEIKETLGLESYEYSETNLRNDINTLSTGDAIFKWDEETEEGNAFRHKDKIKGFYIDRTKDRLGIINKTVSLANEIGFRNKNPWLVVGKERIRLSKDSNPLLSLSYVGEKPKRINAILGTPSSLEEFYQIEITRRRYANMVLCSQNEEINLSITYFTALSMYRQTACKIFVFASEDKLNNTFENYFSLTFGNDVVFAKNMNEYNIALDKINGMETQCLIFWFGLDDIIDDMQILEPKPANTKTQTHSAGLSNSLLELQAEINKRNGIDSTDEFEVDEHYDRSDEIFELFQKGSGFAKYSFLVTETAKSVFRIREIKSELFEHKFAYCISADDSSEIFGMRRTIEIDSELKNSTVIYSDGSAYSVFRPYLMDNAYISLFNESTN